MLADTGLSKIFPNKIPQVKEIEAKINETTSKKLLHSERNDQQNHHQTNKTDQKLFKNVNLKTNILSELQNQI